MPLPSNDRALRRLVADLATAPRDDIDAVLDELEPRHRQAVQSLVAELLGPATREDEEAAEAARRLGLSPWLAGLVGEGAAAHAGPMPTPAAMAALRACVAELQPDPAHAPATLPLGWRKRLGRSTATGESGR